jgi:hypothetical protein
LTVIARSFLLVLLVAVAACDYSLVGRGSALPEGVASVSLDTFADATGEPNIDVIVTGAVNEEFVTDGRLKVQTANADARLTGKIVGYVLRPVTYDADNNVTGYQVNLTVSIVFTDARTDKPLTRQTVADSLRYDVTSSLSGSESARRAALTAAAKKIAEKIVSSVVEGF